MQLDNIQAFGMIFQTTEGYPNQAYPVLTLLVSDDSTEDGGYSFTLPKTAECEDLEYDRFSQAAYVNAQGLEEEHFLCYVEDCLDPPLAVVRAEHACDAQEWFTEELPWADVPEDCLPEVKPEDNEQEWEHLSFTSRGTWVETESIRIFALRLVQILTTPEAKDLGLLPAEEEPS